METESLSPFTVVLETTEPFGPEVRTMHEDAADARQAALRALHHWHNDMDFNPNNTIEELEDGTARVLAVLEGHTGKELARNPSGQLV
jgi:hypothetical protein